MATRLCFVAAVLAACCCSRVLAGASTANDMPSDATGECMEKPCGQGALYCDAMLYHSSTATIAFVGSADFDPTDGWTAGPVTLSQMTAFFPHPSYRCELNLRGVSILKILQAMVGSSHILENNGGETRDILQYSGVRATYSTTLSASARLLKAEWWDKSTSGFQPIARDGLYTVALLKYDKDNGYPYTEWWQNPSLNGESVTCSAAQSPAGKVVQIFMDNNSPYEVPQMPSSRLLSQSGGTAIVVEQDGPYCKSVGERYDASKFSCVSCAEGKIPNEDGTSCVDPPTEAPTPAPITPAYTSTPLTNAPTGVPSGASPATGAPLLPTMAPLTPVPAGSSAASGPVSPTPPSGASTGTVGNSGSAVAGAVAGTVALVGVISVAAFVVWRRRKAKEEPGDDTLDSTLVQLRIADPVDLEGKIEVDTV